MQSYLDLLSLIVYNGDLVPNRTGVSAYTYPHAMIRHDMAMGFPLLTTKKMAWKSIKVELEFFIKGLRDKTWLQERGCHIWDQWCNPAKIPGDLSGDAKKEFQLKEPDLGPVYGCQWRDFNSENYGWGSLKNEDADQLKTIVNQLKTNPTNRQLVCSAWDPLQIHEMALPPCHVLWHVWMAKNKLHLCWFQRSVDQFLGLSFNIASFGLLLHLLCKETGYQEGILTGFLSNVHIYENHMDAVSTQLQRTPYPLPTVKTEKFTSIFNWTYEDTVIENYQCHPAIKAEIAV